ncbi:jacalin-related lectin Calsepa [Spinacia oleracea]|uniref:Jacalin-related lectin Calsepa n=1 Tax=Spinacia oleracea TaxID=3562 RepID=A0A9R0IS90_SPIOL|nr:jacalin-related lectin Calsepa-like [Spinacia oleracea]
MAIDGIEIHGPYGSEKEMNWSVELGVGDYIKEIIIGHGYIVDAIGFVVADATGIASSTIWCGGRGGNQTRITLKSNEYITRITGKYGRYSEASSEVTIGTLTIHTNLWPVGYGPYGEAKGCNNLYNFSTPLQAADAIVKICGSYHRYLGSIGIHVKR